MCGFTQSAVLASFSDPFLAIFIDTTFKACAIGLLAAVAATVLYKSSAAMRHMVWGVAFLGLFLLPILSPGVPKYRVLPGWLGAGDWLRNSTSRGMADFDPSADGSRMRSRDRTGSSTISDAVAQDRSKQLGTGSAAQESKSPKRFEALSIENTPTKTSRLHTWPAPSTLLFAVWAIGAGLLLLRIGASRIWLNRELRSAAWQHDGPIGDEVEEIRRQFGIGRRVFVFLSSRGVTPMTWGLVRQQVLLPADATSWERQRLRTVLLHELAHLKHHDTITHVLTGFIRAIYWFHPFVWLAAWRLQVERERACDDAVLRSGVRASDYAEDLLSILAQREVPSAALAIVGQSELEGRLRAIINEKINRKSATTRVLVPALVLGVIATTALASLRASNESASKPAASPAESSQPELTRSPAPGLPRPAVPDVSMICVDATGKPVTGAEVHLFQYTGGKGGRYVHLGPFISDASGRALCAHPIFASEDGKFDRFLYARVPGRLMGIGRSHKWMKRRVNNPEAKIVLLPSRSVEGNVTVPTGFNPTKVVVRARTLTVDRGSGQFNFEMFPRYYGFADLDTALPDVFECHPDSQGRFRLADVPIHGRLYLAAASDGLGEAQWWNVSKTFDQPIRMTMETESIASGTILAPDGAPAVGMKVSLTISPRASFKDPQFGFQSLFRTVTDAAGKFTLRGLPATKMILSVEDPKKLWTFRPLEDVAGRAGKAIRVTGNMENGVLVSGRVFDAEARPVQGAALSAIAESEIHWNLSNDSTDANGRYQIRLPAGGAQMYFNALPDDFAYPTPQIIKHLEIKSGQADIHDLNFTVRRQSDRGR
jgi:beta-lactamase regulating signal transducer with metallopeptidase domain